MANKRTLTTLRQYKQEKRPIAMLTCYDYATAVLLQEAGVDCLLVGDSLAQMALGHSSTLKATMNIMVALTGAVRRGAPDVYLVGDMPFMSYQVSSEEAIRNAGRFMAEADVDAVKLEVDYRHVGLVAQLCTAGIAVMAHLGYRPQAAHQSDKHVQSRSAQQAIQLVHDVDAMLDAGVCSILLECVTAETAKAVAERTNVPVISCGSGPYCDGQVLVIHDVLGLPGSAELRFVKRYGDVGDAIRQAATAYVQEVQQGEFPDAKHCFHMKPDEQAKLEEMLKAMKLTR